MDDRKNKWSFRNLIAIGCEVNEEVEGLERGTSMEFGGLSGYRIR